MNTPFHQREADCPLATLLAGGFAAGVLAALIVSQWALPAASQPAPSRRDPAAWGADHVGKPVPDFMTGDECLFCHRDIGTSWQNNRHHLTIRTAAPDSPEVAALAEAPETRQYAAQVQLLLGGPHRVRYLKRSTQYGKLDLLSAAWRPGGEGKPGALVLPQDPQWLADSFGKSCSGCHTTGVDPGTSSFTAWSLDCCTCHGDVQLNHTKDKSAVILSTARRHPARVVVSICGQCHIRTGKSRSTGSPFANNFVAGDNLFRDLAVDWSEIQIGSLNPLDAHVLRNSRDVVIDGQQNVTCLSCHDVHRGGSEKHKTLNDTALCATCHSPNEPKSTPKLHVGSKICEY